jgi:hypothetical protein
MVHHTARRSRIRHSVLLLAIALSACSDKKDPIDPTPTPTPLPPIVAGVAIGPPAIASIGPSGGTVALADGSASVAIPAGALSRATDISMQAISNIAPNGIGMGIRLGPANVTFAAPVTVTLKFDAVAADSSSPEGFGIARQDSTGAWFGYLGSTVDAGARVVSDESVARKILTATRAGGAVSTRTSRGGDYVPGRLWIFDPLSAIVATNGTVALKVLACHDERVDLRPTDGEDLAPLIPTQICLPSIRTPTWSVNGIVRGNATVGEVAAGAPTTATYRAPASVPRPATVSVSVALFWPARGVTKTFTSRITIVGSDIKLRLVGAYVNPKYVTNTVDFALPSAIEDRVTLDLLLSSDARTLRSFTVLDNPVAAIVRDGGFAPNPFLCRPPVTFGTFDYIRIDTTAVTSDLVAGNRLFIGFVGESLLQGANAYLVGETGGCDPRAFVYEIKKTQRDAIVVLPALSGLPDVGRSANLDDRVDGAGWFWIVTRLANP